MPKIEDYADVTDYYEALDEFWAAALDSIDDQLAAA